MRVVLGSGLFALVLLIPTGASAPKPAPGRVVLSAREAAREAATAEGAAPAADARTIAIIIAASEKRADTDFAAERTHGSDVEDRALADAIADADVIELRGGSWVGWYEAAHDGRHERGWTRALRSAHARGAEVRASGGAAAWIAAASAVQRTAVHRPSQDPHDTSLDVLVEGLGLFDAAVVGIADCDTTDGVGPDRVVDSAMRQGRRDVLLLSGTAEFTWDAGARRGSVAVASPADAESGNAVLWLDLEAGKRSREIVRGARLAVLHAGDAFDERTRTIVGSMREAQPANGSILPADIGADVARRLCTGASGRIRAAAAFEDERTASSPHGGWSGVGVNLEFVRS